MGRPKREIRVIEGIEYLQCGKCKKWKEFNGFDKKGKYKDGTRKYSSCCKECKKEYDKKYCEVNKEKRSEQSKEWREANKERKKEYDKEYRKANKKKISEYHKEYDREYRKANKKKISEYHKEYDKEYRKANKKKISERRKEHYKVSTQKSLDHTKKICSQNGLINDKLKDKRLYGIIYLFQNKINKRCYVGQTTIGLENRYSKDVIEGWIEDRKTYESVLLEEDIKKYDTEVFTCDIIDIGYCRFHLDKLEAYYIDKYKAFEEGYNNNRGHLITSDGIQEFKELIKEYGLEELVGKEAIEFFEKNLEEEIV